MDTILIDPVTRIEGHLSVKLDVNNGTVKNAKSAGTMFRGFEVLSKGRDPKEMIYAMQRVCGVCPIPQGTVAALALEAAAQIEVPKNAQVIRNYVQACNFVDSHILHFYLLTLPDYVPGPQHTPWTPAWNIDMRSGLGTVGSHLAQALVIRRQVHEMAAKFAGRMPNGNFLVPGGVTTLLTSHHIDSSRSVLNNLAHFVRHVYLPDVKMVADAYSDYFRIGRGPANFLSFGAFEQTDGTKLFQGGMVKWDTPNKVAELKPHKITEAVRYSFYREDAPRRPEEGRTTAIDPSSKEEAYSWLKAPRYSSFPTEVGPLARMWINGCYRNGVSVMDRHLARAEETLKLVEAMGIWLDQLTPGLSVHNEAYVTPQEACGVGLTEAPRGALGHWLQILEGKVANYQVITPTCWNLSPKDNCGVNGPLEQAIVGTEIYDQSQPIEVMRIVHSFDPCLACAVH